MTRYSFRFPLLLILWVLIAQGAVASETNSSGVAEKSDQQKGMEENLQDSVPTADLQEQQNQGELENPRLVIQENLKESPDVRVVTTSDQSEQPEPGEFEQDEPLGNKTREQL